MMIPVLTSIPRSGTHYFKAILARALGIEFLERRLPTAGDLATALREFGGKRLIYDHLDFSVYGAVLKSKNWPGLKIIALTRHPFDRLLSQMTRDHAMGAVYGDPPQPVHEAARDLLLLKEFKADFISEYHNFVTKWVISRQALLLKYEDLIADPVEILAGCLRHLGVERSSEDLAEISAEVNFASLSGGRSPGEIDPTSHYRRGVAGEWRTVYSAQDQERLICEYRTFLAEVGYAHDIFQEAPPLAAVRALAVY